MVIGIPHAVLLINSISLDGMKCINWRKSNVVEVDSDVLLIIINASMRLYYFFETESRL